MTAYTNDNFEKAIQNLEAIPKHSKDHEAAQFYTAISYLANHAPEKSLQIFKQLSQSDDFLYIDGVQWYLALSYLELGQTEKANPLLKQISKSTNHYKSGQAKNIINEMK